jgi:nucleotide-binding universal stress UspA family protein
MEFKNILVPVDFSDSGTNAARLAVALATQTGAEITLLHVGVVPHFYATELGMSGPSGPLFTQMSQEIAREQRARLDQLAKDAIPAALTCRTLIREGFPPEEVLDQAKEGGHDLIVMGTHGRTGLKRALLGSVTERVVRESPIPVMVTH